MTDDREMEAGDPAETMQVVQNLIAALSDKTFATCMNALANAVALTAFKAMQGDETFTADDARASIDTCAAQALEAFEMNVK